MEKKTLFSPVQSSDCRYLECNDSLATACKNPDAHDPWLHSECSIGCILVPARVSLSLCDPGDIHVAL